MRKKILAVLVGLVLLCGAFAGIASVVSILPSKGRAADFVIAASNSLLRDKLNADVVCTGTNDDSVIQAELNQLPASGGEVLMLAGTYNLNAPITMHSYNTLEGVGDGTRLIAQNGLNNASAIIGDYYATTNGGAGWTYQHNITVRNFWLDCNGDHTSGAIWLAKVYDPVIDSIHCWNFDDMTYPQPPLPRGAALDIGSSCTRGVIRNCITQNCNASEGGAECNSFNRNGFVIDCTDINSLHMGFFAKDGANFENDSVYGYAGDTSMIVNAQRCSDPAPISFTFRQPDIPRALTFSITHANITDAVLEIDGTDIYGKNRTFTFEFNATDGWSGATGLSFATITAVKIRSMTGSGSGDTLSVGSKGTLYGIYAMDGDALVEGCSIENCSALGSSGIYTYDTINDMQGSVIDGNHIYNCYYGINNYGAGSKESNNYIINATGVGIRDMAANPNGVNVTIQGNYIIDSNRGIDVGDNNTSIIGNYCLDSRSSPAMDYGILVSQNASNVMIVDNRCIGWRVGGITITSGASAALNANNLTR